MRLRHRSAPSTHLRLSRAGLPATGRADGSRPLIGEWRTQTVPPQRRAVHGLPVPESPAASPRGAGRGVARRLRPPPVTEPPATVTGNHHMLVRHNTPGGDVGQMCTPATEPPARCRPPGTSRWSVGRPRCRFRWCTGLGTTMQDPYFALSRPAASPRTLATPRERWRARQTA
jgi:hypothetical protein